MPSSEFYRQEAERMRASAAKASPAEGARWRQLAAEYDLLAESMESPRGAPQTQRGPMQQEVQQQLSKTQDEEP